MKTARSHGALTMPFSVRPMKQADVRQAVEIERQAFPTLFPPTAFRHELAKRDARYIVAFANDPTHPPMDTPGAGRPRVTGLGRLARGILGKGQDGLVAGFLGLWYIVDEAHIVTVGVRKGYRGCGIGELLLISAIEQAMAHRAAVVTLEVRPSNGAAINLYRKYGFVERGIRKAYYSDNREDALIMTTDPVQRTEFRERFMELRAAHRRRRGASRRVFL